MSPRSLPRLLALIATWRPAKPGDTPGQLEPGEDDTRPNIAAERWGVQGPPPRTTPTLQPAPPVTLPDALGLICTVCGGVMPFGQAHYCVGELGPDCRPQRRAA